MISILKLYKADNTPKSGIQLAIDAAIIASIIILIPLAATFLTTEMQWDMTDFVIIWLLLFTSSFAYKMLARKTKLLYRLASGLTIITALFMTWVNLGVGIVGSGPNLPNLLYGAIPVIGFLGAIAVNFKPTGMARTLFVMAIVNAIIALVAIIAHNINSTGDATIQIILLNGFFIVLWAGAGLMYRNAAVVEE